MDNDGINESAGAVYNLQQLRTERKIPGAQGRFPEQEDTKSCYMRRRL